MKTQTIEALRPQTGDYGTVLPGGTIKIAEDKAKKLIASGNWATPSDAEKLRKDRVKKDAALRVASAKRADVVNGRVKQSEAEA